MDIADILDYTELEWGSHQRQQYRSQLRESLSRLAEIPSLGRVREDLAPGLRAFPVGSHLVCYLVRDDSLFVARVLHGRQDVRTVDWTSVGEGTAEDEV
jgi:toxin ParE1/3/4